MVIEVFIFVAFIPVGIVHVGSGGVFRNVPKLFLLSDGIFQVPRLDLFIRLLCGFGASRLVGDLGSLFKRFLSFRTNLASNLSSHLAILL